MDFKKAIERINNINYEKIGVSIIQLKKDEKEYYTEQVQKYLFRVSFFLIRKNLGESKMCLLNKLDVNDILGYENEDVFRYCNDTVNNFYKDYSLMKNIVEQYLLLIKANENDLDNNLEKYIRIFEPMVELLENGIDFKYIVPRMLDIPCLGRFVLKGLKWYEFYYNRLQKEIAEGKLKLEDVDC